jgi:hypothetical protein
VNMQHLQILCGLPEMVFLTEAYITLDGIKGHACESRLSGMLASQRNHFLYHKFVGKMVFQIFRPLVINRSPSPSVL